MTKDRNRLEIALILALLASAGSLAIAFIAQYGFDLKPCELCLMQRVPYVLIIIMALLGLWKPRHQKWLLLLVGLSFLADSGIASYHAAVEKHWVQGPSACTDTETRAVQSFDAFMQKINHAPINACDQPQWEFHGITMAAMNAVWALLLTIAVFAALQQSGREDKTHA